MKYWFRLLLLVGTVLAVFAVIGSCLPRSYDFSTQIEIQAAPRAIFTEVNSLTNWKEWSQWNPDVIPGLRVNYSGSPSGVGATQTWTDVRGTGKLWITKSVADERIEYEMLFDNFPKMFSQIELIPKNNKTEVRWSSHGRLPGGPFYGYFAPFFSTHMEGEYENNLAKLKLKLEKAMPADPLPDTKPMAK